MKLSKELAKADKARRKQSEVAAPGLPRTGSRRGPTIRLGAEDAPVENIKQRRSRSADAPGWRSASLPEMTLRKTTPCAGCKKPDSARCSGTARQCTVCEKTYCGECKPLYMVNKRSGSMRRLSIGGARWCCKACDGVAPAAAGGSGEPRSASTNDASRGPGSAALRAAEGKVVQLEDASLIALIEAVRLRVEARELTQLVADADAALASAAGGVPCSAGDLLFGGGAAAQSPLLREVKDAAFATAEAERSGGGAEVANYCRGAKLPVLGRLLKKQLEQRDPLLPSNAFDALVGAVSGTTDTGEQLEQLKRVVPYLRVDRRSPRGTGSAMSVLASLCHMLAAVVAYAPTQARGGSLRNNGGGSSTATTTQRIAYTFGPILVRPTIQKLEGMANMALAKALHHANRVVAILIDHQGMMLADISCGVVGEAGAGGGAGAVPIAGAGLIGSTADGGSTSGPIGLGSANGPVSAGSVMSGVSRRRQASKVGRSKPSVASSSNAQRPAPPPLPPKPRAFQAAATTFSGGSRDAAAVESQAAAPASPTRQPPPPPPVGIPPAVAAEAMASTATVQGARLSIAQLEHVLAKSSLQEQEQDNTRQQDDQRLQDNTRQKDDQGSAPLADIDYVQVVDDDDDEDDEDDEEVPASCDWATLHRTMPDSSDVSPLATLHRRATAYDLAFRKAEEEEKASAASNGATMITGGNKSSATNRRRSSGGGGQQEGPRLRKLKKQRERAASLLVKTQQRLKDNQERQAAAAAAANQVAAAEATVLKANGEEDEAEKNNASGVLGHARAAHSTPTSKVFMQDVGDDPVEEGSGAAPVVIQQVSSPVGQSRGTTPARNTTPLRALFTYEAAREDELSLAGKNV